MEASTRRHVNYAQGYAGLGLFKEAEAELAAIVAADRFLPEVVGARVDLHWEAKQWPALIEHARELTQRQPEEAKGWIAWAFALRELGCALEAKAVLLEAEPRHGKTSAVLHYNLGCYHCLLGEFEEARLRLQRAFKMHPPFRADAQEDPDLAAMRDELK
jgi:tetratricopeptide (TPR) repeat protein